jgi:hypothetical protein
MSNYVNDPNFLHLAGEVLTALREVKPSQFGNPQYVRNTRSLLRNLIEAEDHINNISVLRSVILPERFLLDRLLRETKEMMEELDKLICEASLQVVFNFQVSTENWLEISRWIVSFEYIFEDLQKHLPVWRQVDS